MRIVIIILVVLFAAILVLGVTTNLIDEVWPVKFHHEQKEQKIDSPKLENKSGDEIKIQTMNGDILKDSSVKNVYNNFRDSLQNK